MNLINVLTTKQKLINSMSSTDNTEQKMEADYLWVGKIKDVPLALGQKGLCCDSHLTNI